MIQSMTGYARREVQGEAGWLTLELRSVNHRFFDAHLRLPEPMRPLEPKLRRRIGERVKRGRVDLSLGRQEGPGAAGALSLNQAFARRLVDAAQSLRAESADVGPIDPFDVLRWPGVVNESAPDADRLAAEATALVDYAVGDLLADRRGEGERIAALLRERLASIDRHVEQIRARLPVVRERLASQGRARIRALDMDLGEERSNKVLVGMLQKVDVAEELDRLQSHIVATDAALTREEPVGRRLDFLMQEFNREANTLGSKPVDAETARAVIEVKVLIEQMREQVQNVA
jgi:uncharacterized protein (TIGR00255 family)